MKKMMNRTHIEGYLYEHDLQIRESGPNSKKPGTVFIMGNIKIATDEDIVNIVPVHFTYVTATTSKGTPNATFTVLSQIFEGTLKNVMANGKEAAAKLRIDSAIGLNEFFVEKNGKEELVSAKRNEGGFVHVVSSLNPIEKERNTFENDIVITGVRTIDADPERNLPEKAIVKGYVFDFRNAVMPVEFSATNPMAISYFEGLEASGKNPVFTKVKGIQLEQTIMKEYVEEGAFGEPSVRTVSQSHKEFLITWALSEPYVFDDDETITARELSDELAKRETYLATIKQRQDEYKASKNKITPAPTAKGEYNF